MTANQLMSILGTFGPWANVPPLPEGAGVDLGDRQQLAGVYRLAAAAAPEGAGVLLGGGTFTASASLAYPARVVLVGGGLFTAAGTDAYATAAPFAGGGAFRAAGLVAEAARVTLVGGGVFTALARASYVAPAALVGGGVFTAVGQARYVASAPLVGGGVFTALASVTHHARGVLQGGGTFTAVGTLPTPGVNPAVFYGRGTFTASGTAAYGSAALLAGGGTFTASGLVAESGAALLAGGGTFTASGLARVVSAAAFAGGGVFTIAAGATVTHRTRGLWAGGGTFTTYGRHELTASAGLLLAGGGTFTAYVPGPPPEAATFLEALVARHLAAPELADLAGVYLTTSPPGAAFPYLVLTVIDALDEVNNSESHYQSLQMQFDVLTLDGESAYALGRAARGVLRPADPPLAFRDGYEMQRWATRARGPYAEAAGMPGGETVWRYRYEYTFHLGREALAPAIGPAPATPAATFLEALISRLGGSPALADLTDVYLTAAAPGAAFPYLIAAVADEDAAVNNSGSDYEAVAMRYEVLALDGESADALGRTARALLLPTAAGPPLEFADGYEMARWPTREAGPYAEPAGMPGGETVWRYRFETTHLVGRD